MKLIIFISEFRKSHLINALKSSQLITYDFMVLNQTNAPPKSYSVAELKRLSFTFTRTLFTILR